MMNNFYSAYFRVAEVPVVPIAERENVEPAFLKITEVIQFQGIFDALGLEKSNAFRGDGTEKHQSKKN